MKIVDDLSFLAIQFFTDVDECTHNLHNCAPKTTCVNEHGSFFCKGLPITLLNNTNFAFVVRAVGDVFTVFFNWDRIVRCIAWFIKFNIM